MNRYVRPVCFAFEPDVVSAFALASFGASGSPTLNTNYSKGFCNLARDTRTFTGILSSGSATISSVSSYAGLFIGMTVTSADIPGGTTITAMNVGASTITMSANATGTDLAATIVAAGGQYSLTFGSQFTPYKRLDSYPRLLGLSHSWDESGTPGSVVTGALYPAAPNMFLIGNHIASATLASLVLQFGYYTGSGVFTAKDPGNGDAVRIFASLTRSTAI